MWEVYGIYNLKRGVGKTNDSNTFLGGCTSEIKEG
jgi:hypothetical protein